MLRGPSATADNLQDLVTGILAPDTEGADNTLESMSLTERAIKTSPTDFEILDSGRELEKFLRNADSVSDKKEVERRVVDWTATLSANGFSGASERMSLVRVAENHYYGSSPAGSIFFLLHDYLRNPSKENLDSIYLYARSCNNTIELSTIDSNLSQVIAYLEERWGEDTADKLQDITGASRPTVRKWLAGSDPATSSQEMMKMVVEAYYVLETGCGMSRTECEEWLHTSKDKLGSNSPWQAMAQTVYYWKMPDEVDEELTKIYKNAHQTR